MTLIDADHHVRGLDDGISLLARRKLQIIDCGIGNGRCDDDPTDIDLHVCRRRTLRYLSDLALEGVARADFHLIAPVLKLRSSEAWQSVRRSNRLDRTACRTPASYLPGSRGTASDRGWMRASARRS